MTMNTNRIAQVAALVGEPARTAMLMALMDGRALTARELADAARIKPATASRHLALLVEASLLSVAHQGRHRYHRLASPEVARVLEGLMQLSALVPPVVGPRNASLRTARTCYDHLAGRLGVAIAAHLQEDGAVVFDDEDLTAHVTDGMPTALSNMGLDVDLAMAGGTGKRPPCRPCLDWSERRMHLAGRLGALICHHCLERGWLQRGQSTRALTITPPGALALRDWMGTARWRSVVEN
jgi:DNA-binding transcriptional ArsR family regulator